MAVTPVARIAFAADSGGSSGSKAPRVAKAIDAAFGRFAHPAATSSLIGGDEYSAVHPGDDEALRRLHRQAAEHLGRREP